MFLSKGILLGKPAARVFGENFLPLRLSSAVAAAVQSTTEKPPVLDKLYRKIDVELRGNEKAVLKSYAAFATMAAHNLGICIGRNVAPEKGVHERLTVLKCVHIYKKHRVQYETRTYFRYLDFLRLTGSTADTFLEYLQRNLPEGVAMKVTKVEIRGLPDSVQAPSESVKNS